MKKQTVRKRRTREHVIADLSVNFVEKQALLCGYTAERVVHDYGYDIFVTTFDANGEVERGEVRLQIKASDAPRFLKRKNAISIDILLSDAVLWAREGMPVILIAYDAVAEVAHWLYMQRYLNSLPDFDVVTTRKTMTVHIPKSNVLDDSAVRQFAGFRDSILRQIEERIDFNV